MEIVIKLFIVFIFYCFRVYRRSFLWEDLEKINNIKCRLIAAPLEEKFSERTEKNQLIIGSIAIISFLIYPLFFPAIAAGLCIFLLGLIWARQSRLSLGKAWASICEVTVEKQPLVTTGPYRWCRNPIYVAFFVEWVGFIVTFAWHILDTPYFWLVALIRAWVSIRTYHQAVLLEERILLKRYGSSYKIYIESTPRYLPLGPLKIFKVHKPIF